ncbi:MBL fold metallo-hydrolase [Paenibacillus allorhizosphaerae]|uniref:Metallo-beta-lactamase domain-containing protein n=1 Tax=Paenibacillus allorhizosphaerae TaxID=2849866 RepID=A0ABM8VMH6_9BACL|nr:MBL fold metallo-hydrolase [Paenibacillus allorhizosphaerae]CAG7650014.1 hypothetical protein PAECIP111802_04613 [Paenibacillus allorhizosphaerae]
MKGRRKRYENLGGFRNKKTLLQLSKWNVEKRAKVKDYSFRIPQHAAKNVDWLRSNRSETSVTWIGHSTFLIQMGGLNLLTDPVWAKRMGLGTRLSEPGLHLAELPRIHAVLLSHSHYDHMHLPSLRAIERMNRGLRLYVPHGLGAKLRLEGFHSVTELHWWESVRLEAVELNFVPAQHWTRRSLFDTNTSHWGGWVIQPALQREGRCAIYFVGDTGYFSGFQMVGERFAIRTALMPIGAYEPEWFMSPQHVNPEMAVQGFLDCGAERFIPMHYGAFRLSNDTPREALDRLLAEWSRRGLAPERLYLLNHGETLI